MVIIGGGRIGSALANRAARVGMAAQIVRRGERLVPSLEPMVVAVRTENLAEVIDAVPVPRRADLVLVQNGALRNWLSERYPDVVFTRGALYLLATGGSDEGLPGAVSPFWGPRAAEVVAWCRALDVPAVVTEDGAAAELEKLLWLAVNGPLCEAHDATVGHIATEHRDELYALVSELLGVGAAAWGVRLDPEPVTARLVAYSLSIPRYRASIKEWHWRNGWFASEAARHRVPTPLHDALTSQRT